MRPTYMTRVKKSFAYDKMFAVIFLISFISLILIWLVSVLQKKCMPWEYAEVTKRKRDENKCVRN